MIYLLEPLRGRLARGTANNNLGQESWLTANLDQILFTDLARTIRDPSLEFGRDFSSYRGARGEAGTEAVGKPDDPGKRRRDTLHELSIIWRDSHTKSTALLLKTYPDYIL